jgi:cation diffusion facilitator CzcD-associated flavoprotein CzcO
MRTTPRIAIVGAGFSGLAAAIRLRHAGFDDVTILERGDEVGGVWRDNTYPGCACDVQSHLYSLSFAPNPSWSRNFSPQPEILAYLKRLTDEHQLRPRIRFGRDVTGLRWDHGTHNWHIEARASSGSTESIDADVVVGAHGALSEPAMPAIEGLDAFPGKVMHSARWDGAHDLRGERVAVVGTGASAIQIVPAIQQHVKQLVVFQRTPPWIFPRGDHAIEERTRRLFSRSPVAHRAFRGFLAATRELLLAGFLDPRAEKLMRRLALRHLARRVRDPELRRMLTPDYGVGCKRILLSDNYLPALTKENVRVVPHGVRAVRGRTIIDSAGGEHDVDTIVLATGFRVTDPPLARLVVGRGGETLASVWRGSPQAHVGTTVHGFPSLFLLQGPNTGLGHSSVLEMIEAQVEHVVAAVAHASSLGASSGVFAIEPTRDAQARWVGEVDRKMRSTVWSTGGCASWYIDATGRNSTIWPGSIRAYRRRSTFRPSDYALVDAVAARPARVPRGTGAEVSP